MAIVASRSIKKDEAKEFVTLLKPEALPRCGIMNCASLISLPEKALA
jgi:hypothetical protein